MISAFEEINKIEWYHVMTTVCMYKAEQKIPNFKVGKAKLQLFLLARPSSTLFHHFSHPTRFRPVGNCVRSAEGEENLVESPFDGFLYWLIEQERQERHSGQAELFQISVS